MSIEEIRSLWLKTEAGIRTIDTSQDEEIETYWQVSLCQMGLRIQRLQDHFKKQTLLTETDMGRHLDELRREFSLCTEIGHLMLPERKEHN